MRGDPIPDKDHIARYCTPSRVDNGKIQATAFWLRPDEEYLSVNWLEYLACSNRKNELAELRNAYSKNLNISPNGRIAALNVGKVRQTVLTGTTDGRNLSVISLQEDNDPSHSGIFNLPHDASKQFIGELIVSAISNVYPACNR